MSRSALGRFLRPAAGFLAFASAAVPACLLALAAFAPSGCALYRGDRCIVPDAEYEIARNVFVRTNSIDLVERSLVEFHWERCRIREALYRIRKEFQVPGEEG